MIRILIIDSVRLICEVMAAALEDDNDIEIADLATTMADAESALSNAEIDLVLISTNLPDGESLQLTGNIRRDFPDTKVVVLGLAATAVIIVS